MRRAVLVTGGSRGIGAAVSRAFAARGDRVAVHFGSAPAAAREVAEELPGRRARRRRRRPRRSRTRCARWSTRPRGALGGIDVLVNNAGVFEPHPIDASRPTRSGSGRGGARSTSTSPARRTSRGARCATCADGGHVVNVSSRGAFRGEPRHPAYGASKAGLVAFGQSLARALGPRGISVTSVAPGLHGDRHGRGGARRRGRRRAAGRRARSGASRRRRRSPPPSLFLASPDATMASGSVLDVNGASFLRM